MSIIIILGYVFVFALICGIAYCLIGLLVSFIKSMTSQKDHSWHLHHEH